MGFTPITVATGPIDGSNTTFTTPTPYKDQTLAVWRNGQLLQRDLDNGFVETAPSLGIFDMKIAPLVDDTLQCLYIDTLPPAPETEVLQITGTVYVIDNLNAVIAESLIMGGKVEATEDMSAKLVGVNSMVGTVYEIDNIYGQILEVSEATILNDAAEDEAYHWFIHR